MKYTLVSALCALACLATAVRAEAPTGYHLVWSDEFDSGTGPDPAKWSYDTNRNKDGWYNNEAQYYSANRAENARIVDGHLVIEARKDDLNMLADYGGQHYSSARLVTQGKAEWTYGFFDVRAKLPCGKGQWPAIWLLGTGPWPSTGEIDIMEAVGHEPTTIYGTTHSVDSVKNNGHFGDKTEVADQCTAFHNYQLDWTETGITFLIDGKAFYHRDRPAGTNTDTWPFVTPEYMILNIAVGGNWGGQQGIDDSVFPQQMQVDYVRVYQK